MTMRLNFCLMMPICALVVGCSGHVSDEAIDNVDDELFGNVRETRLDNWVSATAAVSLSPAGTPVINTRNCSGTLVAPDRVLTAAHCLCDDPPTEVRFANHLGQLDDRDPVWPVIRRSRPDGVRICGDTFISLSDDDPVAHAPRDVAVLTIGPSPQTGDLPNRPFSRPSTFRSDQIPIIKPILSDPVDARATGRLSPTPDPANPTAPPAWIAAGYGQNTPWRPAACSGCNTRRSGPIFGIQLKDDPCEHVLGIPLEADCFSGNMWLAPSIPQQASIGDGAQIASGDSGGGLFFTDTVTNTIVLGGVCSNSRNEPHDENDQRWAAVGLSGDFLWDAMGLPPALTLAQQRQGTAVYAKNAIRINDRAVVTSVAPLSPRLVSAAR